MTTQLQTKMIVAIAEDLHTPINEDVPECKEDALTYAEMIIETAQDKGVFTSILNAGIVWHVADGRDSICGLTDAGFAEYQRIKNRPY